MKRHKEFFSCVEYLTFNFQILKLVSTIFYQMIALKNYEKCFLFHQKSSFCSQDIQIFVIFSLPFQTFQI